MSGHARVIDGTALSRSVRAKCRERIDRLHRPRGSEPALAVILVGDNPASHVYVCNKARACAEVGIRAEQHPLPAASTEDEVLERVRLLNADPRVDAILVQLPLPPHIRAERVLGAIALGETWSKRAPW